MTLDHLIDLQWRMPEEIAPGVWSYFATPHQAHHQPPQPEGGEWDIVYPVGVMPTPFIDYGPA